MNAVVKRMVVGRLAGVRLSVAIVEVARTWKWKVSVILSRGLSIR